jgi:hypothetical protein
MLTRVMKRIVPRVALSNLAHKYIKVKMVGFLIEEVSMLMIEHTIYH